MMLVHVVNPESMANWEESIPEMDMADGLGSVILVNPTFTREKALVVAIPGFAWIAVKLESVRASVGYFRLTRYLRSLLIRRL